MQAPLIDRLRQVLFTALASLVFFSSLGQAQEAARELFDGETLDGWQTQGADERWWTATEGEIRGGSLTENIPHNTFLATKASYQNFELSLKIRIEGSDGLVNSGIQIRSTRVEGSAEMSGYQVDAGEGWWGKLYDESRRNRVIAEPLDAAALEATVVPDDWNEYVIRAEGTRIRSWINGVAALDYKEPDLGVPLDGHIGIQVHSGGKVLVRVKDVRLEALAPTPGAMTWRRFEKARSLATQGSGAIRSPEEELAGFDVLEGFEVELVAADPSMNKVVDIAFDDGGRMYAITAVEYPIDANESGDVAEMYRRGGRDQVLVFDEPWKQGPQVPRVFVDGLFIPMAILPGNDGVLVGQGPDILRFIDDDGDGRADRRETVLTGFGIQDSHLLPHRFVRAPGGWIYVAQGAFNSSQVVTKLGETVTFNKCKLGRFKPDGTQFEVVGVGLNNIWGFVLDRQGDKWIQEANDLGYPLVPFEHGRSYPGIGMERFHSHSPWHPPYADFRMGGTGLSGLARSQDRDGFPAPWNDVFFLANPILSSLQAIHARRDEARPSEVTLERVADLLTSADKNFRPVAIHFGPDGCLYVVDWYNPIISHNEVPRDHPDRDKTSSRIWRIRHESQERRETVNVSAATNAELIELLGSDRTMMARAAWHQIVDRNAVELADKLKALALDNAGEPEDRILALWSLEGLERVSAELLRELLDAESYTLRREAARLAPRATVSSSECAELLADTPRETDPRVRLAAIEALSSGAELSPESAAVLLRFVRPLPDGPLVRLSQNSEEVLTGVASDIAFERSLVRASLQGKAELVFETLHTVVLDRSTRRFGLLCAGGSRAATVLAGFSSETGEAPSAEELTLLAKHVDQEEVRDAVLQWLALPEQRTRCLEILLASRSSWSSEALEQGIVQSVRELVAQTPSAESHALLLRCASELRISALEEDVVALLLDAEISTPAALRTLMELDCRDAALFHEFALAGLPGDEQRRLAIGALAGIPGEPAYALLLDVWPALDLRERKAAVNAMLALRWGAARLVEATLGGDIQTDVLDDSVLARLTEHLGDDLLLSELKGRIQLNRAPVLRLDGAGEDFARTQLTLHGPFTVEAWVRLDPGIDNADGLLAAAGVFDLNFHDARLRLWLGGGRGDVITAHRRIEPETWTHVALTRDDEGRLALYMNGVLDATGHADTPDDFAGLDVGRTIPGRGTSGALSELRVWSVARSARELGATYRSKLSPEDAPVGLELILPGEEVELSGSARIEGTLAPPPTQTLAEQRAEAERFGHYRALAATPGDLERGREVFAMNCAVCHRVAGTGIDIGPVLDGVASKGVEGILRSVLTPNAGVESGYRTLIVRTVDGELLDGFLAAEDEQSIVLRRKDREDLRLPRSEIESARFDELSLMPEGLLEALTDEEARDLLGFLASLE